MKLLYDSLITVTNALLPVAGVFNKKLHQGCKGRARTWDILNQSIKKTIPKIWVHAASLGEYEQIVPVLEKLNRENYQIVLTFFSPSGYENKKNTQLADTVCYLPMDTIANVSKFMDIVAPSLVIMVKYEFWPNYLRALHKRDIKTVLVSGVFRENMTFNKWYGSWMTKYLKAIDHFFLQNEDSFKKLSHLGFNNASVSGDTRFDRASQLIERDNRLDFLDQFVDHKKCLVIGSSWPEDILVLQKWLRENYESGDCKVIIAPHEIEPIKIEALIQQLDDEPILWSSLKRNQKTLTLKSVAHLQQSNILIIDTIGLLTKAYSYATIAYVGGAMGTSGLHNILEAATYGVPVIIGKNYEKFPEAGKLEDLGGLFSVSSPNEFMEIMDQLLTDDYLCDKTGMICGHWINSNTGATREVLNYLKQIDEKLVIS
ncbi:3-deoxy-D-manno-octulosonic acid transferase [Nonlabens arenilitoris]|uniref:3-deoxy-D-manno-octulosonic acid transferase n=1 Tax=Nonlabens arenilitoris TaxID=1217969 RepID=A0A2S7UA31_9FLAO|nr:glycosyltransferase N-terminal domain-containing protein [Nonlabens arenilitoris]PQJ31254.1 3-deoxy-D-manno-octulosonic acid transferase [Nonlabens arenilitoris]